MALTNSILSPQFAVDALGSSAGPLTASIDATGYSTLGLFYGTRNAGDAVNTPTYNGTNMTALDDVTGPNAFIRGKTWLLHAPPAGSHTLSLSLGAASDRWLVLPFAILGGDGLDPTFVHDTIEAGSVGPKAITSAAGKLVVAIGVMGGGDTATPALDNTQDLGGAGGRPSAGNSGANYPAVCAGHAAGATSVSFTASGNTGVDIAIMLMSFAAASGGGGGSAPIGARVMFFNPFGGVQCSGGRRRHGSFSLRSGVYTRSRAHV